METLDCYTAVAVQFEPHVVYKHNQIEINLKRAIEILDSVLYSTPNAKAPAMEVDYEPYAPVKLVAFPEEAIEGLTDEQFVRSVVRVVYGGTRS